METALATHREKIARIGGLLFVFVLVWMILNSLALLVMLAAIIGLRVIGSSEARESIIEMFAFEDLVPGLELDSIQQIVAWDFETFVDHFWLTLTLAVLSTAYFVATMILILRIARSLKKGELLSHRAIGSLHILGWLYVIQGTVSLIWGVVGQFLWTSNTCELLYFSFIQDVCSYSFTFSGSGIEWGMLALALSWIAKSYLEEQELIV